MKKNVIEYLEIQIQMNNEHLENYDQKSDPKDPETVRIREMERIKLNDRILELKRHIKVIKVL
ncbi:MAG: hypothetical protein Q8O62_11250 [Aequorivita sp.]|nr:hypothetical protein [Aequorivita sp.]